MLLSALATAGSVSAQCNPLHSACDPVPALGGSLNTNFVNGASDRYVPIFAADKISYGSNGVDFEISAPGNNPSIDSNFYLMFGRIEFEAQAAPGVGIVSSVVLISDDDDEIDIEWLGGDGTQVQSNYFSKGDTSTYDRGAFHPINSPQTNFYTYAVDWNSERTIWYVNGAPVRTLINPGNGYYPQSPMKIRFGSWAGGDSSNAPGTIEWAGGATDYSAGPFNFYVRNLNVQDYSTGTAYKFNDQSGSWTSVEAIGGAVNGNLDGSAPAQSQSVSSESAPVSSTEAPASSTEAPVASSTEAVSTSEPISSSEPSSSTEVSSTSEPASSTEISTTSVPASSTEVSSSSVPASSTEVSSSSVPASSTEVPSSSIPASSTEVFSTSEPVSSSAPATSQPASSTVVSSSAPATFEPASSTEVSSTSVPASSTSEPVSSSALATSEPASSTVVSSSSVPASSTEISSSSVPASSTEVFSSSVPASSTEVSSSSVPASSTEVFSTSKPVLPVEPATSSEPASSTLVSTSLVVSSSAVESSSISTVIVQTTTSKPTPTPLVTPTLSTVFSGNVSQVAPTLSVPQVNGVAQRSGSSLMALIGLMIAYNYVF